MRVYFMGDKAAHMAYAHCLPHVAFYGLHFWLLLFGIFFFFLARQLHTKLIFSIMDLAAGDVVGRRGNWEGGGRQAGSVG